MDDVYDEPFLDPDDEPTEIDYEDEQPLHEEYVDQYDVAYRDWERVGLAHIDTDMQYTSQISGYLGRMEHHVLHVDPEEEFRTRVNQIFNKYERMFSLTLQDQSVLLQHIKRLSFIKHKNPLAYVLGYILYTQNETDGATSLDRAIEVAQRTFQSVPITSEMVVRYRYYWNDILTDGNIPILEKS